MVVFKPNVTSLVAATFVMAAVVPSAGSASNYARLAAYMPKSEQSEAHSARTAAPAAISSKADIFVLGPEGYRLVSKGNNGFTCLVERSWAKDPGDPEFWNAKMRAPTCYNAAAARWIVPSYFLRTTWVLNGATETGVRDRILSAVKAGKVPASQTGAMSYMMSKEQYLTDQGGHPWHPHVMFYYPASLGTGSWGANLNGSPVISNIARYDRVITFMVPVSHWSDGTSDVSSSH